MATVAVFIALGGSSYAALRVGSRQIVNNSVKTGDLRNNDIRGKDIRRGTVQGSDVAANTLSGTDVNESSLGQVPTAAVAASATSLGGKSAADLTLSCPADTKLVVGLCFETTPRAAATLSGAIQTCGLAGRRLPDYGELTAYGQIEGVPALETTSNYYIEQNGAVYNFSYVSAYRVAGGGSSGSSVTPSTTARAFRCVVAPTQ